MGFAGSYLQKAALRGALFETEPPPGLEGIVIVPVHNEPSLEPCLESLLAAADHPGPDGDGDPRFEVLLLINAAAGAPAPVHEQNLRSLEETRKWIEGHSHPRIGFHVKLDHGFGKKESGVGLARKLLMDEAARRFSLQDRPEGWIASLDADAVVDPDYLTGLTRHFGESEAEGCSIYFEHPLSPEEAAILGPTSETLVPAVWEAITRYELHLRYYVHAVRSTGYPHAHHTVGSSFAVRAGIYCQEGGMSRRQGGEDFYFIQKVARRGRWSDCTSTRVMPSPRPSDRVPFGTGPAVAYYMRQWEEADPGVTPRMPSSGSSQGEAAPPPFFTYHPEPFRMLKRFFEGIDEMGRTGTIAGAPGTRTPIPEPLASFLHAQQFSRALEEIRANSASPEAFRKRFWRWFHMFRIMKFLHCARERGYPDIPVEEAARTLLEAIRPAGLSPGEIPPSRGAGPGSLLESYRKLDRAAIR